jgi:hypothetical protein
MNKCRVGDRTFAQTADSENVVLSRKFSTASMSIWSRRWRSSNAANGKPLPVGDQIDIDDSDSVAR